MDRSPLEQDTQPASPAYIGGMKPRLAWLALFWEAVWPALWPSVGVAGLFLSLALLDVLPSLGFALHLAALVLFLAVFLFLTVRNLRRLRLPERRAALRRLETASGLGHRPLSGLQDTLGSNPKDPMAQALWQAHQARLARLVRGFCRRADGPVEHGFGVTLDAGCGLGGRLVAACFAPTGEIIEVLEA